MPGQWGLLWPEPGREFTRVLGLGLRVIWRLLQGFEFGRASMWVTVRAYEKTVALRVTATSAWELGLGVPGLRFWVLGFGLGERLLGSLMSMLVLQVPTTKMVSGSFEAVW